MYGLHQNLSLNLNSMSQKEETSLYCSKLDISLTGILDREDMKIKKVICSQHRGILKPLIYRLLLICNLLEDSQRRDCLNRLSLTLKTFNYVI